MPTNSASMGIPPRVRTSADLPRLRSYYASSTSEKCAGERAHWSSIFQKVQDEIDSAKESSLKVLSVPRDVKTFLRVWAFAEWKIRHIDMHIRSTHPNSRWGRLERDVANLIAQTPKGPKAFRDIMASSKERASDCRLVARSVVQDLGADVRHLSNLLSSIALSRNLTQPIELGNQLRHLSKLVECASDSSTHFRAFLSDHSKLLSSVEALVAAWIPAVKADAKTSIDRQHEEGSRRNAHLMVNNLLALSQNELRPPPNWSSAKITALKLYFHLTQVKNLAAMDLVEEREAESTELLELAAGIPLVQIPGVRSAVCELTKDMTFDPLVAGEIQELLQSPISVTILEPNEDGVEEHETDEAPEVSSPPQLPLSVPAKPPFTVRLFSRGGPGLIADWVDGLGNEKIAARVWEKVARIERGAWGVVSLVNKSNTNGRTLIEFRLKGPGLRLYGIQDGPASVLLLVGGPKDKQDENIKQASAILKDLDA